MGRVRLLLALLVFISHSPLAHLINGHAFEAAPLAVQCFFVISGFLIAFILDQKYHDDLTAFYHNRFVRLAPAYIAVAGLALLMKLGFEEHYIQDVMALGKEAAVYLVAVNALLVGQDAALFLDVINRHLMLTADFKAANVKLYQYILVPQAWSLSLEIYFYGLIPFLIKRRRWLMSVFAASVGLRLVLFYGVRLDHDPWTYRFFPTELAVFLLGVIAYQYRKMLLLPAAWHSRALWAVLLMLIAMPPLFVFLDWGHPVLYSAFILGFALLMPTLFAQSRDNAWDATIGDLSYPLYLGHILVIQGVSRLIQPGHPFAVTCVSLLLSVLLAVFIKMGIEQPAQNYWKVRKYVERKP
jgi:peptidoglycan/LPS O-acetylase OafA/YrhL